MANTNNTTAIRQHIAAIKAKFAELDALDEEFADFDDITPEGEGIETFNLLSEKREELETEIRSMRERVQLISEWEKFKGSGWSDDVQLELNALDQQFTSIAEGAEDAGMSLGAPAMPDMPVSPEEPISPEAPLTPEVPAEVPLADPEMTEDPTSMPIEEPAPAEPLPAVAASSKNSKIKEKINYELQDRKRSSTTSGLKKGDTHMANTPNKPSLKEKLAEVKSKREAIQTEAKKRVASAWTIAKTMLPTAPAPIQKAMAASLLQNSTKVLTAALRQTAINSHNTKLAETFEKVHQTTLNEFVNQGEDLNAEKKAVSSELKGDPKNAGKKKADDTKETGEQPETYDDGRDGSEPKEMDASKAAERPDAGKNPGQTQNLSEGKNATGKKACVGKDCSGCTNKDCKGKKASTKKADGEEMAEEPTEAPAAEEAPVEAPAEEEVPSDLPAELPENPEAEAAEILTDEKKEVLEEKIDEAQAAIKAIENEILEESSEDSEAAKLDGDIFEEGEIEGEEEAGLEGMDGLDGMGEEGAEEELDFSKVFDEGAMDEKVSSLANEGEDKTAGEEDDMFAPDSAKNMEASLDDHGMGDMNSMFSMHGADGDPLASLIAGLKTAEEVAGMSVVPSNTGEAANHFEQEEVDSEDRDHETDHSGDLWAETIENVTPEEQGAKRVPQDSTNELEMPKAAKLKKIRMASGSDKAPRRVDVGDVLFNDGFDDSF